GQKLGDREQIGDALRQVQQLEAAALAADSRVSADDFSEARAVYVGNVGEIQEDLAVSLVDETVDLVFQQFIAFPEGDFSLEVEHHNVADGSFLDVHGLRSRPCESRSLTHHGF